MTVLRRFFIAFGLAAVCTHATAQKADTALGRWIVQGGIYGSANMHSSSFRQLPGIPNCCVTFTGDLGFGGALVAGVEYVPETTLFGLPLRAGANVSYTLLTAALREPEVVGNIIRGNDVFSGTVEHRLAASYAPLSIEPYIALGLPGIQGLRLKLGVQAGIPIMATYEQSQMLLTPSDPAYTFENGSRTRARTEGSIPQTSALYAAAVVGLRYELQTSRQLVVAPEVQYNIGLTNIVKDLTWSISSIRFGVLFQYRPERHVEAPPPPPVAPPPPPPPPVIARLESTLNVTGPDGKAPVNDTLHLPVVKEHTAATVYHAAPVVFFEANSTRPLATTSPAGSMQQDVVASVRAYMEAHPDVRLTVIGSTAADEDASLAKGRITWAVDQLGLDPGRLSVQPVVNQPARYPELADEQRMVRFAFNGAGKVLDVERNATTRTATDAEIRVAQMLVCEAGPCTSQWNASVQGTDVALAGGGEFRSMTIPAARLESAREGILLNVSAHVQDTTGRNVASQVQAIIMPDVVARTTTRSVLSSDDDASAGDIHTLGYFDFDGTAFTSVNDDAIAMVREALRNGKRIRLYPGTDNLGTEQYNQQLQRARARAATQLVGAKERDADIHLTTTDPSVTSTPMGRMARRSVRVSILP